MKDTKMNIITGFLILIGVFVVLLGWLHLVGWSYSGNKTLIVAAIGLIGAIIGGAISGALTLFGVKMTIDEKRETELLSLIPSQIMLIDEITKNLNECLLTIRISKSGVDIGLKSKFIINSTIKDKHLLQNAAKVNLEVYRIIKRLYDNYSTKDMYSLRVPDAGDVITHINICKQSLNEEKDKLENKLENKLKNLK